MILAELMATILLWLNALLHIAILRDRNLPETLMMNAGRWLIAAGLCGLAISFTIDLVTLGYLGLSIEALVSIIVLALGGITAGLERLVRRPQQRRSSDLMGLGER